MIDVLKSIHYVILKISKNRKSIQEKEQFFPNLIVLYARTTSIVHACFPK